MKKDIHPKYHKKAIVTCACGNTFETGSTKEAIKTEICSACHPFFTGKQKFVDTSGRMEKFAAKQAKVKKIKETTKSTIGKKARRAARTKKVAPVVKKAKAKTKK